MNLDRVVKAWQERPRRGGILRYWSSIPSGWAIYTKIGEHGFYLRPTGVSKTPFATAKEARAAAEFGPFESLNAAAAAYTVMKHTKET